LTFQQAEAHCENEGMRLCTRAEMETEMCCGTGGNCDSRSVWTSTVSQSTDLIVDPCDSCVAESQCHTATCSDGICIQSFKPANTQCDDNDDSTDGDVCDGAGICVGADAASLTQHEELKLMVKNAFENVKLQITRNALPGLIRKAFHDAGHFDKSSGETRMGCIQHFLSGVNACPQHGNLEEAESFVNAVMNEIPSGLTMADAVQLLGALAVDELAQGTDAPLLYDRVRTGRNDPTALECTDNIEMCNNLPAFFTRFHATDDHEDIVTSLNDVWNKEIDGKMIDVNSLSKQDAVALIGAHTVGRHFEFGHWVQQPNIFDNEYFVQLKRVKDWLASGGKLGNDLGHPFGQSVRSNWFIDSQSVTDPNVPFPNSLIMMMDSDLTLVINAPELVEKYATDLMEWRKDFDDAYIVMSELGFSTELLEPSLDTVNPSESSFRRLLYRAEELLDEDFEFFQNLQIHREEQIETIHAAFRRKV